MKLCASVGKKNPKTGWPSKLSLPPSRHTLCQRKIGVRNLNTITFSSNPARKRGKKTFIHPLTHIFRRKRGKQQLMNTMIIIMAFQHTIGQAHHPVGHSRLGKTKIVKRRSTLHWNLYLNKVVISLPLCKRGFSVQVFWWQMTRMTRSYNFVCHRCYICRARVSIAKRVIEKVWKSGRNTVAQTISSHSSYF